MKIVNRVVCIEVCQRQSDLPEGHHIIRQTQPNLSKLKPFAKWLFQHSPTVICANSPRDEFQWPVCQFKPNAKNQGCFLFTYSKIKVKETDEHYWNLLADNLEYQANAYGIMKVKIGLYSWYFEPNSIKKLGYIFWNNLNELKKAFEPTSKNRLVKRKT